MRKKINSKTQLERGSEREAELEKETFQQSQRLARLEDELERLKETKESYWQTMNSFYWENKRLENELSRQKDKFNELLIYFISIKNQVKEAFEKIEDYDIKVESKDEDDIPF